MREKKPYQVLTFHTTDAAMEMESFCKQNGIAGRLVPVPRRLSAGCGIAWRMEAEVYAQYQTVIAVTPATFCSPAAWLPPQTPLP